MNGSYSIVSLRQSLRPFLTRAGLFLFCLSQSGRCPLRAPAIRGYLGADRLYKNAANNITELEALRLHRGDCLER